MLRSRFVGIIFLLSIAIPSLVLAQDAGRLTSASNVRLRSEPVDSAGVVVTVPLGTALVGIETGGPDRTWLRVRTGDGKEGWVLTRLTRRFDAENRLDVIEQVVTERLARKGDSFAARAEVVDLLDRTIADASDAERAGRLALLWIRAVGVTATTLPAKHRLVDPYASWVEARKTTVWWDEVGAHWMLSLDALKELHERHRTTSSADAIAWSMVENGVGGECEGYLPCYVERTNMLEGEYLRRHPNGKRVDDAVRGIGKTAAFWLTRLDKPDAFSPEKDCDEMKESLTPLRAAIAATKAADRDTTLEKLDVFVKRCGGEVAEPVAATPPPTVAQSETPAAPSPAATPRPARADSRTISTSLFGIAAAGLLGVAAMIMLRRRHSSSSSSNRITLP